MRSNSMSPRPLQARSGFTLIELIVAVAILAILIATAVPSFREIALNNRGTSTINDLMADLSTARSEAVKRAAEVSVSPISGDWNNGWVIRATETVGVVDTVVNLKQHGPINPEGSPVTNQFLLRAFEDAQSGSTPAASISFGAMGQARTPDNGARFSLCRPDDNTDRSKGIRIDLSGRAQAVTGVAALGLGCS